MMDGQMKKNKLKHLHMGAAFFATILAVILVLKLLNWLPSALQDEGIKKYSSIDDVRTALKIPRVFMPAYFPEYIMWPPAEIFAQRRPFHLVMMHFTHLDSRSFALSISQADSRAGFEPQSKSDILYVRNESRVNIKGRTGTLVTAVCSGRQRCNRLFWDEGIYRITLIADDTPEQLIRMAESIY